MRTFWIIALIIIIGFSSALGGFYFGYLAGGKRTDCGFWPYFHFYNGTDRPLRAGEWNDTLLKPHGGWLHWVRLC